MEVALINTPDVPQRSLADELHIISGRKERKFLLFRIAGLDIKDALTFTGVNQGSYNAWCEKPDFRELNRRRGDLERDHRSEAVKLLRRENQIGAVVIEQRIIETLLQELDSHEYDLMRTPIAKTVYDKLMQDIDAMPTITLKTKQTFIDKMAVLMGGMNNDRQAENSQPAQSTEGKLISVTPTQRSNQEQAEVPEERTLTGNPLIDGIVIEGEIVEGKPVGIQFVDTDHRTEPVEELPTSD